MDEIIDKYSYFIFDCDGVLWISGQPFVSSIKLIKKLQELNKKIYFITNNSTKSRIQYQEKMHTLGYTNINTSQIYCSSVLTAMYIKKFYKESIQTIYFIGENGFKNELKAICNLNIIETDLSIESNDILGDEVANYKLNPDVDAVVIGWNRNLSFRSLTLATLYLRNIHNSTKDCKLIASNTDCFDRVANNRLIPGNGPAVSYLETAGSCQAIIMW